jgi:hypothetical protein
MARIPISATSRSMRRESEPNTRGSVGRTYKDSQQSCHQRLDRGRPAALHIPRIYATPDHSLKARSVQMDVAAFCILGRTPSAAHSARYLERMLCSKAAISMEPSLSLDWFSAGKEASNCKSCARVCLALPAPSVQAGQRESSKDEPVEFPVVGQKPLPGGCSPFVEAQLLPDLVAFGPAQGATFVGAVQGAMFKSLAVALLLESARCRSQEMLCARHRLLFQAVDVVERIV